VKRKFLDGFVACLFVIVSIISLIHRRKPEVVEVPFTFDRSSVIVRVKVNGKGPYNMLLDTGAEQCAVDMNTARELSLKLTPIGGGKIVATGKQENSLFLTKLPQIEIGSLTAKTPACQRDGLLEDQSANRHSYSRRCWLQLP
jgi:predicted aspartyl protease